MLEGAHTTAKEVLSRMYPKNSGVDVQLDETRIMREEGRVHDLKDLIVQLYLFSD